MDIHDLIMDVNNYIMAIHNCCELSIIEFRVSITALRIIELWISITTYKYSYIWLSIIRLSIHISRYGYPQLNYG